MIKASVANRVLNAALEGGADFAEIFAEDSFSSRLSLVDSRPETAMVGRRFGCGIRLFYGTEQIYITTSDLSDEGLFKAAKIAAQARGAGYSGHQPHESEQFSTLKFDEIHRYGTRPAAYSQDKKLAFLKRIDLAAREGDSRIVQVLPYLNEKTQKTTR